MNDYWAGQEEKENEIYVHSQWKKMTPMKLKTPLSINKEEKRGKRNLFERVLKERLHRYLKNESIEQKIFL